MSEEIRPDIYISADVETDGPIPGPYSMLSFGLAVVGAYDGHRFEPVVPPSLTFYRELRPISETFDPQALEVNGLDRNRLLHEGADPDRTMAEAGEWVRQLSGGHRPVLVAYPVAFDWSFLYWYFERFAPDGSPFGFSSCLDIRTVYQTVAGTVFDRSGKAAMPASLVPSAPHTHNALDDAIEQGELFANVLTWAIERRRHWAGDHEALRVASSVDEHVPSWLASHLAASH